MESRVFVAENVKSRDLPSIGAIHELNVEKIENRLLRIGY